MLLRKTALSWHSFNWSKETEWRRVRRTCFLIQLKILSVALNQKPLIARISQAVCIPDVVLLFLHPILMKSRKIICTTNLKPYLFNPSVHAFCFWVPSIIINMAHNQWLVILLLARQLVSEMCGPLKGQPVWHPVIIHCRRNHHRRVRLVDTQIQS